MSEFPKKNEDKVNTFTIAMIGGVAAILLWASVVALQAYYAKTGGDLEARRNVEGQDKALRAARAEQLGALAEYTWVDRNAGTAKLPIERAMKLVAEDAQAKKASLVPSVGAHDTPTVTPEGGPVEEPAAEVVEPGAGTEAEAATDTATITDTATDTATDSATDAAAVPPTPTLPLEGGGSTEEDGQ